MASLNTRVCFCEKFLVKWALIHYLHMTFGPVRSRMSKKILLLFSEMDLTLSNVHFCKCFLVKWTLPQLTVHKRILNLWYGGSWLVCAAIFIVSANFKNLPFSFPNLQFSLAFFSFSAIFAVFFNLPVSQICYFLFLSKSAIFSVFFSLSLRIYQCQAENENLSL